MERQVMTNEEYRGLPLVVTSYTTVLPTDPRYVDKLPGQGSSDETEDGQDGSHLGVSHPSSTPGEAPSTGGGSLSLAQLTS